jgi:hypothetical protein
MPTTDLPRRVTEQVAVWSKSGEQTAKQKEQSYE